MLALISIKCSLWHVEHGRPTGLVCLVCLVSMPGMLENIGLTP